MGRIASIAFVLIAAVYIFSSGGLNLATITGFIGWIVAVFGFFAAIGGMKKEGIAAIVIGILIVNLPNMF